MRKFKVIDRSKQDGYTTHSKVHECLPYVGIARMHYRGSSKEEISAAVNKALIEFKQRKLNES